MTRPRRIGVLGGTFDPIHRGHLLVAEELLTRLGLDTIVFAPSGESWHKQTSSAARSADRLAMARIATADDPRLTVTDVDIMRSGPTFTIDTLTELQAQDAGEQRVPAEWTFIAGADALADFDTWRDPEGILALARVIGVTRPGFDLCVPEVFRGRIETVQIPSLDISSREIRRRVAAGESIAELVPDAVAEYIAAHGLYAPEPDASV